jgi:polyferredoxin
MFGSANYKSISSIPVKVVGHALGIKPVSSEFRWKRRAVQALCIVLSILIPATGLFRIDPLSASFVVIDRQIWMADFSLVTGAWLFLASSLVLVYSTAGTVFCGWACPQNTMAEWANTLTRKLLGKHAEVSLDGEAPRVANAKNKITNWLLLGGAFLGVSMIAALIPLFYFYPPNVVWSFVTLRADARLAGSLHYIYVICVLIIFVDIALVRHFWCRYACIYGVWMHSFKTKHTLHVAYDASRNADCVGCNYCVNSCIVDIDPRKTNVFDSCINCGDCIDACNRLHIKDGTPGLLRFDMLERTQSGVSKFTGSAVSLLSRMGWTTPFVVIGGVMFVWGLWTYEPYHVAVDHANMQQGSSGQDYTIAISNKLYRPAQLRVRVLGLPQGSYTLSSEALKLPQIGRDTVILSIAKGLPHGLYSAVVEVSAGDVWVKRFQIQHWSE